MKCLIEEHHQLDYDLYGSYILLNTFVEYHGFVDLMPCAFVVISGIA